MVKRCQYVWNHSLLLSQKDLVSPVLEVVVLDREEISIDQRIFTLRQSQNIAMGDKENNSVPEADEHEIALFRNARKHLPDSVFNEEKWRKATGDEYWNKVL